jgi:pyruvate dehydrogenase E1 component beta subunit
VDDSGDALPLDTCFTLREGADITLVSWGAMIKETLEAADLLTEQAVSCEVIDVATVSPLDKETLLSSVSKTGRCVIVQEAPRNCSVGSEISSLISEQALLDLQAPVGRVSGYDTVMPYYKLENQYLPNVKDIMETVKQTLEFA